MKIKNLKYLLVIFILIFFMNSNILHAETDFDFGFGLWGLDLRLMFINNFGNVNIYGNVGYYTDYFFNNLTNNYSGQFSGDVKNVKSNYFTVGGKIGYSFLPLPFMMLNILFKNQSYVYFSPGISYTNAGFAEKQFYYLNRISLNSIIGIVKILDADKLKHCWFLDLNFNYYPSTMQNPTLTENLLRYTLSSYIKINLLKSNNFDLSFFNLFVYDKLNKKENIPFLINSVECGELLTKYHNYGKGIGTAIRGVSTDKYGYLFENDLKSFINNDIRFIIGDGFLKYGLILYYDIFSNNNYSSLYNSTGAGIVLELVGFALIFYYNYFITYKEGGFSFTMGYKF